MFQLISPPMKFPPQAVIGGSSPYGFACRFAPGRKNRKGGKFHPVVCLGCRPASAENAPLGHFPGASTPPEIFRPRGVHAAAVDSYYFSSKTLHLRASYPFCRCFVPVNVALLRLPSLSLDRTKNPSRILQYKKINSIKSRGLPLDNPPCDFLLSPFI